MGLHHGCSMEPTLRPKTPSKDCLQPVQAGTLACQLHLCLDAPAATLLLLLRGEAAETTRSRARRAVSSSTWMRHRLATLVQARSGARASRKEPLLFSFSTLRLASSDLLHQHTQALLSPFFCLSGQPRTCKLL